MPGLDLVAVQDEILAHIQTTFPNYEIKEDEVLDDEYLVNLNGNVKPFLVVRWHGLNRSVNNNSFAGVRWDEYNSAVDIIAIAPSPRIARRVLAHVMDGIIGWVVPGGGQLIPSGGASVSAIMDPQARPHLYLAVNTLTFQVDSNAI